MTFARFLISGVFSRWRRGSPFEKIHEVVREAERTGNLIGVRFSACDEEASDPWLMPPSQKKKPKVIAGPLPDRVAVTLGNLVYVPKDGLPSALLNLASSRCSVR